MSDGGLMKPRKRPEKASGRKMSGKTDVTVERQTHRFVIDGREIDGRRAAADSWTGGVVSRPLTLAVSLGDLGATAAGLTGAT